MVFTPSSVADMSREPLNEVPTPADPTAPRAASRLLRLDEVAEAANCLRRGDVIAYPTEAVFGLGADPDNEAAVAALFALKGRPPTVGVLLVAADFEQVRPLIDMTRLPADACDRALASWPGAMTWVFPRSARVAPWVTGGHDGIALRVTAHPATVALCRAFGAPLISTSANPHGQPPARDIATLTRYFGTGLAAIVDAPLGGLTRATPIRDALTGQWLRR